MFSFSFELVKHFCIYTLNIYSLLIRFPKLMYATKMLCKITNNLSFPSVRIIICEHNVSSHSSRLFFFVLVLSKHLSCAISYTMLHIYLPLFFLMNERGRNQGKLVTKK